MCFCIRLRYGISEACRASSRRVPALVPSYKGMVVERFGTGAIRDAVLSGGCSTGLGGEQVAAQTLLKRRRWGSDGDAGASEVRPSRLVLGG